MGFQCFVHGAYVGGARAKAFNAEYYTTPEVKALAEEHKKATGEAKLPGNGYPDMGSGRYSSLLPYAKWLAFNNAQRAHGNYVEGLASIVTFTTAAALTFCRSWPRAWARRTSSAARSTRGATRAAAPTRASTAWPYLTLRCSACWAARSRAACAWPT